jgi:ribosomal protein S18 acetylase RimI-like enzyme
MLRIHIVLVLPALTFRTIDPDRDEGLAYENYLEACRASFGGEERGMSCHAYLEWLRRRVEEFPDGHVLAITESGEPVGQMELQVPYGLTLGYVNLYCVSARYRGLGFGRAMHGYAVRYFRAWEAETIELHVSPTNDPALKFYRRMGYRYVRSEGALWRMAKDL